jgi:hypothetical protein
VAQDRRAPRPETERAPLVPDLCCGQARAGRGSHSRDRRTGVIRALSHLRASEMSGPRAGFEQPDQLYRGAVAAANRRSGTISSASSSSFVSGSAIREWSRSRAACHATGSYRASNDNPNSRTHQINTGGSRSDLSPTTGTSQRCGAARKTCRAPGRGACAAPWSPGQAGSYAGCSPRRSRESRRRTRRPPCTGPVAPRR